jgi:hypothetical protein
MMTVVKCEAFLVLLLMLTGDVHHNTPRFTHHTWASNSMSHYDSLLSAGQANVDFRGPLVGSFIGLYLLGEEKIPTVSHGMNLYHGAWVSLLPLLPVMLTSGDT